jgi:hypothetical protein
LGFRAASRIDEDLLMMKTKTGLKALLMLAVVIVIAAPSPPLTNVTGTIYNDAGLPAPGTKVTFTTLAPQTSGSVEIAPTTFSAIADGSGAISVQVPRGIKVNLTIGRGTAIVATVPDQATVDLSSLLAAGSLPPPAGNVVSALSIMPGGDYGLSVNNPAGQGIATLTLGQTTHFSLGMDSSAGGHKITGLAPGAATNDALAYGQGEAALNSLRGTGTTPIVTGFDGLLQGAYDPQARNVSGSDQNTTGSMIAGSATLTLAAAIDIANNQDVRILGAGAALGLSTPPAPSAAATCSSGCTHSYLYKVRSLDGAGGYTAASAASTNASNNATLDSTHYNIITFTWDASATRMALYESVDGGAYAFKAMIDQIDATGFKKNINSFPGAGGVGNHRLGPSWLTTNTIDPSQNDWLVATVNSGGGTTALALSATASTTVTSKYLGHDDTRALQALFDYIDTHNGGYVYLPLGAYHTSGAITLNPYVLLTGAGPGLSTIICHVPVVALRVKSTSSTVPPNGTPGFGFSGGLYAFGVNGDHMTTANVEIDTMETHGQRIISTFSNGDGYLLKGLQNSQLIQLDCFSDRHCWHLADNGAGTGADTNYITRSEANDIPGYYLYADGPSYITNNVFETPLWERPGDDALAMTTSKILWNVSANGASSNRINNGVVQGITVSDTGILQAVIDQQGVGGGQVYDNVTWQGNGANGVVLYRAAANVSSVEFRHLGWSGWLSGQTLMNIGNGSQTMVTSNLDYSGSGINIIDGNGSLSWLRGGFSSTGWQFLGNASFVNSHASVLTSGTTDGFYLQQKNSPFHLAKLQFNSSTEDLSLNGTNGLTSGSLTIKGDGSGLVIANKPLSMSSQRITSLAAPTAGGDALSYGNNATIANLTVTGTCSGCGGSGSLPGGATAGQFLLENAAANAAVWASISGDASNSTSTPGQLTVNHFTLGSNAAAGGFKITGIGAGTVSGDALAFGLNHLNDLASATADYSMGTHRITGLAAGTSSGDAFARSLNTINETGSPTADFSMNSHKMTGLSAATATGDALSRGNAALVTDLTATRIIEPPNVQTISTGTGTISFATGDFQKVTLASSPTITLSGPTTGQNLIVKLVQDATGGRVVTWSAGSDTIAWINGTAPTLTTTPSKADVIGFVYDNGTYSQTGFAPNETP